MKTYHIKDLLKKDLLIVELPENGYYEVFKHGIYFKDHLNADRGFIEGSYALLGSADEIKESDAMELVESWESVAKDGTRVYENYKDGIPKKRTSLESFHSALESEIYWDVNPLGFEPKNIVTGHGISHLIELVANSFYQSWHEAQEKTFDKNRSIIFVKK